MATGTISSPLQVEQAQFVLLKEFTSVKANRITRIGNQCVASFNGILKNKTTVGFTSILQLPAGWSLEDVTNDFRFAGTANASASSTSIAIFTLAYGNPDQDHNAIFVGPVLSSAGSTISFTVAFNLPE